VKLSDLTDRDAVNKAMGEFDIIGREAFLKKYGFGTARTYFIERDGRRYDSKAVAGAALSYQFPGRGHLSGGDFSGGERTVARQLGKLGYPVVRLKSSPWDGKSPSSLKRGDQLSNSDLCAVFECGTSGGMRRSHTTNTLLIVSDPTKGFYIDEWRDGVLHYCGMGLVGHQSIDFAQNKTLAESATNGVTVHLFEVHKRGVYEYVSIVRLAQAPYIGRQPDKNGQLRRVWIFPVRPTDQVGAPRIPQAAIADVLERQRKVASRLSAEDLAQRAMQDRGPVSSRVTTGTSFVRNEYVAEYARRRAAGKCELCETEAPFKGKSGEPYLECHHIVWFAHGGTDTVDNTVALCPNCHRKMHILNRSKDRSTLERRLRR
jgi:5-methylcytosine-specific restriction protein A